MVKHHLIYFPGLLGLGLLLLGIALILAPPAQAQQQSQAPSQQQQQQEPPLDVTLDKRSLYESETLTLTIKGETELELSLDSLMNLRSLDLPEPNVKDLRVLFDVLDQRQSYALRSINGKHSAAITWTYQLAPRQAGELTIPAISFNGAQSEPQVVEVKPGSPSQSDSAGRIAWVEAEVSKDRVFLQEKLVLTLSLYYQGSLVGGDLSEPQLQDAIFEPLGEQRQTSEFIDGQRFQKVERKYLIYPQRSGELLVPAQQFTGRQRDPASGALRFLRAQSPVLTVDVVPPPSDFPGDRWIAAESLVLGENWSRPPETIRVGDSLTRVLTLRTLGLLKSALPEIEVNYPDNLKAYPEGARSESEINAGTIEASQSQTTALVAIRPGEITLPETRLHWWDTLNDQARVAVIPARTLTVLPAPGSAAPAEGAGPSTAASATTGAALSAPTAAETDLDSSPFSSPFNTGLSILAVFFALAWLVTLLLWLRWRKRHAPADQDNAAYTPSGVVDLSTLKQHALDGRLQTLQEIPPWVRETFQQPRIRSLQDTRGFFDDAELSQALDALEQYHFGGAGAGTAGEGANSAAPWQQGPQLAAALERLHRTRAPAKARAQVLPPFRKVTN